MMAMLGLISVSIELMSWSFSCICLLPSAPDILLLPLRLRVSYPNIGLLAFLAPFFRHSYFTETKIMSCPILFQHRRLHHGQVNTARRIQLQLDHCQTLNPAHEQLKRLLSLKQFWPTCISQYASVGYALRIIQF